MMNLQHKLMEAPFMKQALANLYPAADGAPLAQGELRMESPVPEPAAL
jgi:hypothetical protein